MGVVGTYHIIKFRGKYYKINKKIGLCFKGILLGYYVLFAQILYVWCSWAITMGSAFYFREINVFVWWAMSDAEGRFISLQ